MESLVISSLRNHCWARWWKNLKIGQHLPKLWEKVQYPVFWLTGYKWGRGHVPWVLTLLLFSVTFCLAIPFHRMYILLGLLFCFVLVSWSWMDSDAWMPRTGKHLSECGTLNLCGPLSRTVWTLPNSAQFAAIIPLLMTTFSITKRHLLSSSSRYNITVRLHCVGTMKYLVS